MLDDPIGSPFNAYAIKVARKIVAVAMRSYAFGGFDEKPLQNGLETVHLVLRFFIWFDWLSLMILLTTHGLHDLPVRLGIFW